MHQLLVASCMLQVCTRPDIAFAVGALGICLSDPGLSHWKAAKKVMRYLQGTKAHMLTFKRSDTLDIVGFCDADYAGYVDDKRSTCVHFYDGRRRCFMEKCQTDTYSFLDHGGTVYGVL